MTTAEPAVDFTDAVNHFIAGDFDAFSATLNEIGRKLVAEDLAPNPVGDLDPRLTTLVDAIMSGVDIDPIAAHAAMSGKQVYGARPIRGRRTRENMGRVRGAIFGVLAANHPMTVRQVFYQLVGLGVIDKTETEYKATVTRLLTEMRREEAIPFEWIADNTRWMRKPQSHSNIEQALKRTSEYYRRALWDNQEDYVEIWLEKDALSGVIYDVTAEWDVPLMITRGYPSITFLNSAAEAIAEREQPAYLYYFGDRDPSGIDIDRVVEEGIREFAPYAEVHFERVAVTPEQISDWNLPTRPTKRSDSRSRSFRGESVEVDTIPPDRLRDLVEDCIQRHVDQRQLEAAYIAEESERELLTKMAAVTNMSNIANMASNASNGGRPL